MGDRDGHDLTPDIDAVINDYRTTGLTRRRFMSRMTALGVSVPVAASILAACGDDSSTPADSGAADTDADTSADTGTEEMAPVQGGTLREGYNRDIASHDPITTNWYDPAYFAIYEAIASNDPDGNDVPQFASGFSISDDGLEWRFTIPEGKLSHSGATIDAEAVAEYYRTVQANSFIALSAEPVDGYEAVGNEVVMSMKRPWIGALGPHKTGYWRIINVEAWNAGGGLDPENTYGTETADGTGPFTHEEWVPGSHTLVNRWPDYPGSQTPFFENTGPAYLDAIRWTVITEAGQRATQIENGDIDTLINPAPQDVDRLESNSDLTVIRHPEWSGYILSINRDYPEFFGDRETRQALSHALDREGMVTAILNGNGEASYGPFPSADANYDPAVEEFNQFDVDLANQLLDEAGWTGGEDVRERDGTTFSFEYIVEDESVQVSVAEAVAEQFRTIGVEANLAVRDRAVVFEDQAGEGRDAPPISGFFWLWPIPIDVLFLFAGSGFVPVPNFSHVNEPRIESALANWHSSLTEADGAAAASEFQLGWAEELPYISIMNQNAVFVKNNRVHGWQPFVWNLYPYYNDTWIEA